MHTRALQCWRKLQQAGLDIEVQELAESTRTAAEAAAAVGSDVGQIIKSLLFVVKAKPLLVLCAGDRRVDLAKLGDGAAQARPDQVKSATGYAIGGVPPLGHTHQLPTVVDDSLRRFATVWCAAGTPNAVFEVELVALLAAIPGVVVRDVSQT